VLPNTQFIIGILYDELENLEDRDLEGSQSRKLDLLEMSQEGSIELPSRNRCFQREVDATLIPDISHQ